MTTTMSNVRENKKIQKERTEKGRTRKQPNNSKKIAAMKKMSFQMKNSYKIKKLIDENISPINTNNKKSLMKKQKSKVVKTS